MGFDVDGRRPKSTAGEHFRASGWCWRCLLTLTEELGSDLIAPDVLNGMRYNVGYGPWSEWACSKMADRFDAWLAHFDGSRYVPTWVIRDDRHEAYWIPREKIVRWAEFLRECGGFRVYAVPALMIHSSWLLNHA